MSEYDLNDIQAQIGILGIPLDENSSYMRGPARAPDVIREAFGSESANSCTEMGIDLGDDRLFRDWGNLNWTEGVHKFDTITRSVQEVLDKGLVPFSFGGDHSVTYPIVRSVGKKFPGLHVLVFDAHPDLYWEFEGNRHSNACPFARIMEEGLAEKITQVGIRAMNGPQREQAERFGVNVHEMKDWNGVMDLSFDGPLYVSFDIDALDPAFAPGVSHVEPGGLTSREALAMIQNLRATAIVGADIVELNPDRDVNHMTAYACAKIFKELVARTLILKTEGGD